MEIILYAIQSGQTHPPSWWPWRARLPWGSWGSLLKTEYLFQLVSQMYNFIDITNCSNNLLTALPGSPLSPLAPGPPSIPYNQQFFKSPCVFTIKMCQSSSLNCSRCVMGHLHEHLALQRVLSLQEIQGDPIEGNGWCQSKIFLRVLSVGVVTHWVSFGSIWSRSASKSRGSCSPRGAGITLLTQITFFSLDIEATGKLVIHGWWKINEKKK